MNGCKIKKRRKKEMRLKTKGTLEGRKTYETNTRRV
jgi:hypothetical protein